MSIRIPDDWGQSPEANLVLTQATNKVNDWIDQSINDLSAKITTEIDNAAKGLNDQLTQITQQLAASRSDLDKAIAAINKIALDPKMTGADLQAAVNDSAAKVKAVQDYLQQREQQWTNAGKAIVDTAVTAGKAIAKA